MSAINLLTWNVNGLRAVHRKGFLEWMRAASPDILCLQEIKTRVDQLPDELREVSGYHAHFFPAQRPGYSGVAIYSKQAPKKVSTTFGDGRFDDEGRTQIADFEDFTVCNVYFPNGKASAERLKYKLEFYDEFLKFLQSKRRKNTPLIVCGDVNTAHTPLDLARPKENEKVSGFLPEERAWIDRLIASGFADTFRLFTAEGGHYSWWDMKSNARSRNVGWRIDYVFASEDLVPQVQSADLLNDVTGSDHCPASVVLKG